MRNRGTCALLFALTFLPGCLKIVAPAGSGSSISYSPGQAISSVRFGDDAGMQAVVDIDTDSSGNRALLISYDGSVTVGSNTYTSPGGTGAVALVVTNSAGAVRWSRNLPVAILPGSMIGVAVRFDPSGNVVLMSVLTGSVDFGGGTLTTVASSDIVLAKYDSNGNHLWSNRYGSTGSDFPYSMAVASNGDIVIAGSYSSNPLNLGGANLAYSGGGSDIFVAKYDASGSHLWSYGYGSATSEYAVSVDVDSSGNPYVLSVYSSAISLGGAAVTHAGASFGYALAKYQGSNGAHVWSQGFSSPTINSGTGQQVRVDSLGDVVFNGTFSGSLDVGGGVMTATGGDDGFVAKFSSSGAYLWHHHLSAGVIERSRGLSIDPNDNSVVFGLFFNAASISFGGTTYTNNGAGTNDLLLVKLESSGAIDWAKTFGTTSGDMQNALHVLSDGKILSGGRSAAGTLSFGDGVSITSLADDGFLTLFAP